MRQQPVAELSDQVHRSHQVGELLLGQEVVHVHPRPARPDPLAARLDLAVDRRAHPGVDAEQAMAVGAGAGTATTGLDAEEIVQQGHDVVVVQVATRRRRDREGQDRQSIGHMAAQDLDVRVRLPGGDRAPDEVVFVGGDDVGAHGLLQREHQTGPDGLHDGGGSTLLTMGHIRYVAMAVRAHEGDRSATDDVGDGVGRQFPPQRQHPGGSRPADELVRGAHHGIHVRQRIVGRCRHLDGYVGRRRGVVPDGQGAVLVQ